MSDNTDEPTPNPGVRCPKCWCRQCKAEETRRRGRQNIRWRRCRNCQHRFATRETHIDGKKG